MAIRPLAFIFDIDGTLADNEHRQHYLYQNPKDWDSFFAAQGLDTAHDAIARIHRELRRRYHIIYITGRKENSREQTLDWLNDAILRTGEKLIESDDLYMRADGDKITDWKFKKKLFLTTIQDKYQVIAVFEDRKTVVDMWRSIGIPCLQCAPGDF